MTGSLVALVWLTAGLAHGQIKLPIYDPDEKSADVKGVSFTPATQRVDYKHGALLRITMKDNSVVRGTLVRTDKKANRLYVRTEPGALPVAVAINDIKAEGDRARVEKGMIEVAKKPKDGPITLVEMVRERVVQPEIFTTTVEAGSHVSKYYTSEVLSSQELAALNELSQAEREVARLETQALVRSQDNANESIMATERLRTQQLLNLGLASQLYYSYPPRYDFYGPSWMQGNYLVSPAYPPLGADFTTGAAIAASAPPAPPRPAVDTTSVALEKARERLRVAQTRAIYEDGQVVAVMYEKDK
jgi:hypothetical protein